MATSLRRPEARVSSRLLTFTVLIGYGDRELDLRFPFAIRDAPDNATEEFLLLLARRCPQSLTHCLRDRPHVYPELDHDGLGAQLGLKLHALSAGFSCLVVVVSFPLLIAGLGGFQCFSAGLGLPSLYLLQPRLEVLNLGCIHTRCQLGPMLRDQGFEFPSVANHLLNCSQDTALQSLSRDARCRALRYAGNTIAIGAGIAWPAVVWLAAKSRVA
jgi:hypothetical protein